MAYLAERPLPDAPDGKYAYQVKPKETSPFQGPTPADVATRSKTTILKQKIEAQLAQGLPIKPADIDDFVVRPLPCFQSCLIIRSTLEIRHPAAFPP